MSRLMNQPFLVAIDPGKGGGIAYSHPIHGFSHLPMPSGGSDHLLGVLRDLKAGGAVRVYLEQVTGYIAGSPRTGASMFVFGENFGELKMAISAVNLCCTLVPPRVWQDSLNVGKPKDHPSRALWKAHLRAVAKNLWGNNSITLKTSDAALILWYALHYAKAEA